MSISQEEHEEFIQKCLQMIYLLYFIYESRNIFTIYIYIYINYLI
jgi:hypothetical protein